MRISFDKHQDPTWTYHTNKEFSPFKVQLKTFGLASSWRYIEYETLIYPERRHPYVNLHAPLPNLIYKTSPLTVQFTFNFGGLRHLKRIVKEGDEWI